MIVLDLCHANYQNLLITYQELKKKNANHAEKKNRSECEFIGFKNERLKYKCKECGKECTKSTSEAIKNFPIMYQFCNGDLNNFCCCLEKVFILMKIWIAGKKLMKLQYPLKKLFTAN